MITLFILSTFEGWPDIMFNFFDADDPENVFLILFKNKKANVLFN
jgi:hypothetical protein